MSPPEMLLALRGEGTGALLFTGTPQVPVLSSTLHTRSLTTLLTAAAPFETGALPADPMFRELLEGSSRAGGARPKALVHDAHGEWIAKFPSRTRDGHHDVERPGLYVTSYTDIALLLSKHSASL